MRCSGCSLPQRHSGTQGAAMWLLHVPALQFKHRSTRLFVSYRLCLFGRLFHEYGKVAKKPAAESSEEPAAESREEATEAPPISPLHAVGQALSMSPARGLPALNRIWFVCPVSKVGTHPWHGHMVAHFCGWNFHKHANCSLPAAGDRAMPCPPCKSPGYLPSPASFTQGPDYRPPVSGSASSTAVTGVCTVASNKSSTRQCKSLGDSEQARRRCTQT